MSEAYNLSIDDAVIQFESAYFNNNRIRKRQPLMTANIFFTNHPLNIGILPRKSFYCGITNDLDRRMSEHNAKALTWVKAKNAKAAIELEKRLGEIGYDIGSNAGNGAADDSVYIYMYKKVSGITKE